MNFLTLHPKHQTLTVIANFLGGTYHAFKNIWCIWVAVIINEEICHHWRVIANLLQDPVDTKALRSADFPMLTDNKHISSLAGANGTKRYWVLSKSTESSLLFQRSWVSMHTYFRTIEHWGRGVSVTSTERNSINEKKMPNSTLRVSRKRCKRLM